MYSCFSLLQDITLYSKWVATRKWNPHLLALPFGICLLQTSKIISRNIWLNFTVLLASLGGLTEADNFFSSTFKSFADDAFSLFAN